MKHARVLAWLLAALLLLAGCSAGTTAPATTGQTATKTEETTPERSVWSPMTDIPDYTLPATASPEEIRAMAVKAMRDELTVQWYVDKSFTYDNKDGKAMTVNSGEVYGGLPYTQSASGLLQWLQYYDPATGKMSGLSGSDINGRLGNSCAASVIWGWYGVTSTTGGSTTFTMTPVNGYLPVGGYRLPATIENYKDYTTQRIVTENGAQAMYAAYAAVQPADAMLSYPDDGSLSHAQMAIEPAHVVYNADGTIDPEQSTVTMQDQHKGILSTGEPFVTKVDGHRVHYAGHLSRSMTFAQLYQEFYMPLTCAEFIGEAPYQVPSVTAEGAGDVKTLSDVMGLKLVSPHKIITVTLTVWDGDQVVTTKKAILGKEEINNGTISNFPVENITAGASTARSLKDGETYRVTLEALESSGVSFTVVDATVTYHK